MEELLFVLKKRQQELQRQIVIEGNSITPKLRSLVERKTNVDRVLRDLDEENINSQTWGMA